MSSWFSGFSLVALLCLASLPAAGQTASLLRDINTESPSRMPSNPGGLHAVRGKVFFAAGDSGTGTEMWASDGSGSGTELLADVCPGGCSASPYGLGSVGGIFLWATDPAEHREEIWRSDGTRAGTYSLNPPGSGLDLFEENDFSSRELKYAVTDRALVFRACTDDLGCELWSTDGTREGTRLVLDISRGPASSSIEAMITAGGKVFFFVHVSSFQWTLGVTDGTAAGTVTMPVVGSAEPLRSLAALGSRIFFLLSTPEGGEELRTSDGTPNGTRVLTQFAPAQPFSSPEDFEDPRLMPAGGKVYFVADDGTHGRELWSSDGTPAGTRRITDFNYDQPFPGEDAGPFVAEVEGDRVVFVATDGVTLQKLWTTRGTAETLAALPDPCQGACQFLPEFPRLFEAGSRVLFPANDGPHGQELWTTDGTAAGTRMIRDLCPGTCSTLSGANFYPHPGVLFFTGSPTPSPHLRDELFRSDGTAAGTRQISHGGFPGAAPDEVVPAGRNLFLAEEELWVSTDGGEPRLVTDIDRGEPSSNPTGFTAYQGRVYFAAGSDFEREIWQTDGTREGTVQLTTDPVDPSLGSTLTTDPVAAGAYLFYVRGPLYAEAGELWRTDGTAPGTVPLVQEAPQGRRARMPTAFQDKAWFFATAEALSHHELWRSDGTPAGTTKVVDLPDQLNPGFLTAVGSDLYFVADRFGTSRGIWRLDGGTGTVAKVTDVPWSPDDDPRFTGAGSRVFFLVQNRLWMTDGTASGTAAVLPADGPPATDLAELGGKLYFSSFGRELWRTDGFIGGTFRVKEFPGALPRFYEAPRLLSAGGRLWLAANDGVHGVEPWVSDGSEAGTVVRDVYPGPESSLPHDFAAAAGRVYFGALDPVHGDELWQSDGSLAGTRMVQDIAPELLSSSPEQLKAVGDHLYFSAAEESSGREPWALPLAGPASCQPSPTRLCLNGGRFAVEARWRDFQNHVGAGQAVALTADTGYFWFFSPSNVEAVVKVLDGRGLNNHFWVFYGALSNVEYTLVVTDTATGLSRQYYNPPGQLASVGDTRGFGPLGAFSRTGPATAGPVLLPLTSERIDPAAAGVPCQPAPRRLCLGSGRFAVETTWKDFQGQTGNGTAVSLSTDTGWFWFFDDDNVEVIVKILDGTPVNGKHWVFYGALSNVEYTVTVTDTQTGKIKTYRNPSGRFASVADTSAF